MSKVPSTFDMDGLFTEEDIVNRYRVMRRCMGCDLWVEQDSRDDNHPTCQGCGHNKFDPRSTTSLRTFNPTMGKRTRRSESMVTGRVSWNDPKFIKDKYKK